MRAILFRSRKKQRGFNLVEVLATVVVVSLGMPAIAVMYSTAFVVDSDNSARTQGTYLGNALMNEISQRRFMESVAFPGNGAETGEVINGSYDRRNFDDIDDYEQFAANGGWGRITPPQDEAGVSLTNFPGYSQYVHVFNVAPPNANGVISLNSVTSGTTDLKMVQVEIQWAAGHQSVTVKKLFTKP